MIHVIFSLSNDLRVLHAREKAAVCVTREVNTPITQFSLASVVHKNLFCFERVSNKNEHSGHT